MTPCLLGVLWPIPAASGAEAWRHPLCSYSYKDKQVAICTAKLKSQIHLGGSYSTRTEPRRTSPQGNTHSLVLPLHNCLTLSVLPSLYFSLLSLTDCTFTIAQSDLLWQPMVCSSCLLPALIGVWTGLLAFQPSHLIKVKAPLPHRQLRKVH